MRIITGSARGRKLIAPPGEHTRPTTDWVKESVFNIIQFDIEGRRVLDIFAGTGQMGIEALSRGAEKCVFVENDRAAVRAIRENVRSIGFEEQAAVLEKDYKAFIKSCSDKFELVFLDPPYEDGHIARSLELFSLFDIISDGGIIVCEGARGEKLPESAGKLVKTSQKLYGNTQITLYKNIGEQ